LQGTPERRDLLVHRFAHLTVVDSIRGIGNPAPQRFPREK
jgi:hypothetical protein